MRPSPRRRQIPIAAVASEWILKEKLRPRSSQRLFIITAVVGASVFAFLMLENKLIIGNTSPCLTSPSTASDPMITTTSEISQSTPSSLSLFDKMHKELHKRAALPNHSVERKKYEVGVSIPRGDGGRQWALVW